jgi:hypothetical protein
VSVAGIASVSALSGQDFFQRDASEFQQAASSPQPLETARPFANPLDTVNFSGGQPGASDVAMLSRSLQQGDFAAAYRATQRDVIEKNTENTAPEEADASQNIDVEG